MQDFCLDIEIDEHAGSVRVFDPRAFCAGRRAFCRRLLAAAARRPGVSKAEVDLASASCQIEFDLGAATSKSMADVFVDAIREATIGSRNTQRYPWWRPDRGWSTLTAYPHAGDVSCWETRQAKPGRMRLRDSALSGGRARLSHLSDDVAGLEGVKSCRISPLFRTITVELRSDDPVADPLLDRVEQALENWKAAEWMQPQLSLTALPVGERGPLVARSGPKRLMYLVLAGGAFTMTLVGLAVPGIPTVPFLLATSYYLARSSPRLNERLRRTAFFGPILNEWEQRHGLSWTSKGKLVGLTATIIVVTVALTPLSPVALVLIFAVSSLSIYGIARLPVLEEEPRAGMQLLGQRYPALPGP